MNREPAGSPTDAVHPASRLDPMVILSGFCDEASASKDLREQLAVASAVGLQYVSLRFLDVGTGTKHIVTLAPSEVLEVKRLLQEYGMGLCSLGSPLGKVKLVDGEDGTTNRFVPLEKYLSEEVIRACDLAVVLGTRLVRGFSFYPPKGRDPESFVAQAVDWLGRIADLCQERSLILGLEVEANLVGRSGQLLAQIHRKLHHPAVMLVFDGGNLACQGYPQASIYHEYEQMREGLGWIHVKDYRRSADILPGGGGHVDEAALSDFVPVDAGDSGYREVFTDLKLRLPELDQHMKRNGLPGIFLELEPHLRGGGQFGGFSGPDGFGIAARALVTLLQSVGLRFSIRDAGALLP